MKKKRYTVNGQIFEIPETETQSFLTDNPHAVEVSYYEVGDKKYNIPVTESAAFETEMGISKKKELGSLLGGVLSTIGGGAVGGLNGNGRESEEKMKLSNAITQVPFTRNEYPFDQTREEAVKGATTKLNDIMYGNDDRWKDAIGESVKGIQKATSAKEAAEHFGVKTLVEQSLMPDGFEAKRTLANTILGEMGDDNLTTKMLKDKANKYDKSVQALRDIQVGDLTGADEGFLKYNFGGQINNAAIKYYAEKHPEFKRDLKTLGVNINDQFLADRIPSGKRGAIKEEFFNDPDIMAYLQKENPNLIPAFQVAEKNHLADDTDYGINIVANKVSKAVQKTGYNDIEPIFNFHDKGHEEMNDLVAQQVLSPQELEIWNNHIKNNQANHMDEPSFFEGVATGIKNTLNSEKKLLTEPFTSESQSIKNEWHKEASNVSADPDGFLKFARDTGNVFGFLMTLGVTKNVTGLSSTNALTLATTGDIIQDSREKYRGEPVKAALSGIFNVAMYRALGKDIFPVDKAKAAFERAKPQIDKIVENLTSGKITMDAARKEAQTKLGQAIEFAGGTLTQNAKITAELTGLQILNRVFDKVGMDENTFKKYHAENEIPQSAKHAFLSFLTIAGLGKYGQMKNANNLVSETIYDAASKPNEYKRGVNSSINLSFADANEIKSNIDAAAIAKKELDRQGVPEKNQKRYLFELLQEKAKKEMAIETGDETLDKSNKESLKEHQEVKEKILAGQDHETIITKKEQEEIDIENDISALTKKNELFNKEMDLKRKELDGRIPDDRIKIEKLDLQREEKNDEFKTKVEKLKPLESTTLEEPIFKKLIGDVEKLSRADKHKKFEIDEDGKKVKMSAYRMSERIKSVASLIGCLTKSI